MIGVDTEAIPPTAFAFSEDKQTVTTNTQAIARNPDEATADKLGFVTTSTTQATIAGDTFVIGVAGRYDVTLSVAWGCSGTTRQGIGISLLVNGVRVNLAGYSQALETTFSTTIPFRSKTRIDLNVGDIVTTSLWVRDSLSSGTLVVRSHSFYLEKIL